MKRSFLALTIIAILASFTTNNAAASCDEFAATPLRALHASGPLQQIVEEMWRRSVTFRRQVVRIARESSLVVTMRACQTPCPEERARTDFRRERGVLRRADMEIRSLVTLDVAEVVGHELEHILEQMDGIDLRRRAGLRDPGVVRLDRSFYETELFETERARSVGLLVVNEYRAGVATVLPCSEKTE